MFLTCAWGRWQCLGVSRHGGGFPPPRQLFEILLPCLEYLPPTRVKLFFDWEKSSHVSTTTWRKGTERRRSAFWFCIRVHVAPRCTFPVPSPWYCMAPTYYYGVVIVWNSSLDASNAVTPSPQGAYFWGVFMVKPKNVEPSELPFGLPKGTPPPPLPYNPNHPSPQLPLLHVFNDTRACKSPCFHSFVVLTQPHDCHVWDPVGPCWKKWHLRKYCSNNLMFSTVILLMYISIYICIYIYACVCVCIISKL